MTQVLKQSKQLLLASLISVGVSMSVINSAMAQQTDHRAFVQSLYGDVINKNQLERLDRIIAQNAISHTPMLRSNLTVSENYRTLYSSLRTAFPDMQIQIEEVISQGDRAVVRYRLKGTHTGEFMGMRASNLPIDVVGIDMIKIQNGQVVEHWGLVDTVALLRQLEVLPEL